MRGDPPLGEFLLPLLGDLPAALIGADAQERVLAVAAMLPGAFVHQVFGFECPLGTADPSTDFLVSATRLRAGGAALAATSWPEVGRLATAMAADPATVDDAWLEFDLSGSRPSQPNLFCRPLYDVGDPAAFGRSAEAAAAVLIGGPLPAAMRDQLLRVAAALPPKATVFQMGAMLARTDAGIRLCVNQISLDGILTWLAAIGYPDVDSTRSLLIRFQPAVGDVALAIDLRPAPEPKIGVECYFAPSRRGRSPAQLLDRFLRELDLCTADKAAALRGFAGITPIEPDRPWPRALLETRRLFGSAGQFVRWLHHIKLVHRPGTTLEAKAYLAVQHVMTG